MPMRIGWYIKDQIFIIQGRGVITDHEYLEFGSSPVIISAMDKSPASMIHYFFEILDPDTTLPSIRVRGRTRIEKHPKDGWSILIGFKINRVWQMTATIIAQLSRNRFLFVNTRDDALDFMQRLDPSFDTEPEAVIDWFYTLNWDETAHKQLLKA